jgi:hypothetical protein
MVISSLIILWDSVIAVRSGDNKRLNRVNRATRGRANVAQWDCWVSGGSAKDELVDGL